MTMTAPTPQPHKQLLGGLQVRMAPDSGDDDNGPTRGATNWVLCKSMHGQGHADKEVDKGMPSSGNTNNPPLPPQKKVVVWAIGTFKFFVLSFVLPFFRFALGSIYSIKTSPTTTVRNCLQGGYGC